MFYWIVIVFLIATMLGLNIHQKDDYRDAVLMPKIEPVVSRAITQHRAAGDYFNAMYKSVSVIPIIPNYTTLVKAGSSFKCIKENISSSSNCAADGTKLPSEILGASELSGFAPFGFNFAVRDPDFDPKTRFVCVDRTTGKWRDDGCTNAMLNRKKDGLYDNTKIVTAGKTQYGEYDMIGYLVTYLPIPTVWDTPYYHNMIVTSIKRLSDNTFHYGIVKHIPTGITTTNYKKFFSRPDGSISGENVKTVSASGVPDGSTRAIYTVVDEYNSAGHVGSETTNEGNRQLVGVFNFIPGAIAQAVKKDFPSRECDDKGISERKDVNGMLVFLQRLTDLDKEIVYVNADGTPDEVEMIKDMFVASDNSSFCAYTPTDEDKFYDEENVFPGNDGEKP